MMISFSKGVRLVTTVIIFCSFIKNSLCEVQMSPARIKTALKKSGIVPDVIDVFPRHVLQVRYVNYKDVAFGNNMTRWETYEDPLYISYPVEKDSYYTLIMTDPDCPSREFPHHREWQHWVLVNIPGVYWKSGFYLTDYIGILSNYEFAVHRYVFILYKQPGKEKLNFTERVLDARPIEQLRYKFSTKAFAAKYGMGAPHAINYFLSGEVPKTTTIATTTTTKNTPPTSAITPVSTASTATVSPAVTKFVPPDTAATITTPTNTPPTSAKKPVPTARTTNLNPAAAAAVVPPDAATTTTTNSPSTSATTASTTTLSPAAAAVAVPPDTDLQSGAAVAGGLS